MVAHLACEGRDRTDELSGVVRLRVNPFTEVVHCAIDAILRDLYVLGHTLSTRLNLLEGKNRVLRKHGWGSDAVVDAVHSRSVREAKSTMILASHIR